jgi:hypothetical protein
VDPDGERTLGVLTKPDLVDKGAEDKVIDLIRGKDMQVRLGWVIVRNLGQSELRGGIPRDAAEEEHRSRRPWSAVDRDSFGINALKARLRVIVTANARQAFSSVSCPRTLDENLNRGNDSMQVRSEVSKNLKARQVGLQCLGPERNTMEQ